MTGVIRYTPTLNPPPMMGREIIKAQGERGGETPWTYEIAEDAGFTGGIGRNRRTHYVRDL
jgi:hypothetical protein